MDKIAQKDNQGQIRGIRFGPSMALRAKDHIYWKCLLYRLVTLLAPLSLP